MIFINLCPVNEDTAPGAGHGLYLHKPFKRIPISIKQMPACYKNAAQKSIQ